MEKRTAGFYHDPFGAGLPLSTTRSRNAIWIFGALLLGGGLLALGSRHVGVPDLHTPAVQAIPVGAEVVVTVDVAALRRSSLADVLGNLVDRYGGGRRDDVKRLCGFDPLSSLSELAVAVPGAPLDGELGISASGDIVGPAIAECAMRVLRARGGRPVRIQEGDFFVVSDPSSTGVLAARTGGPVLVGGASYVRQMIAAAERRSPSVLVDARHLALRHEAGDTAPLLISALLTADSRERIRRELDGATAPATSVVGLAVSISPGASIDVHAVVGCDRPEPCAELRKGLAAASDKDGAPLPRLLARARLESDGPTLHGRTSLAPAEIIGLVVALTGG